MKLIIIAALTKNRVIGRKGSIPWHLPDDIQRFKRITSGHTVLMGKRTFESIGHPLINRRNVVLSSKLIPDVETYASLPEALEAVQNDETVFVIGGGKVFSQLLHQADELMLTLVHQEVEGDTYFPEYNDLLINSYTLVTRDINELFEFVHYIRR